MEVTSSIGVPGNGADIPGSRPEPFWKLTYDQRLEVLEKEVSDRGNDPLARRLLEDLSQSHTGEKARLADLGLGRRSLASSYDPREMPFSILAESDESFLQKSELRSLIESHEEMIYPSSPEDPMGHWPARLLHIPSMTSMRWKQGNEYEGHREPRYAVLSYTWGRWELPKSEDGRDLALKVTGIDWDVPSISPDLFSVEDFERVLLRVSEETGVDFIWVDVACINQNPSSEEKAREIGRQAKIFSGASFAFIWLLGDKIADDSLNETTRDLIQALEMHLQQLETVYQTLESTYRGWSLSYALSDQDSPTRHPGPKLQQEAGFELDDDGDSINLIIRAATAIEALTRLPWFSSTWTLQEAFIQSSALLLNRNGDFMLSQSGSAFRLKDLLMYCRRIYQVFSLSAEIFSEAAQAPFEAVITRRGLISKLRKSGLQALASRDRLSLYSCARLRQARDQNDSIYGIMQVWGFQLGRSAPGRQAEEEWSLEDLEVELGMRLLHEFPIESQLQVHTRLDVPRRQAWRVSEASATPLHTLEFTPTGHLDGEVDRHSSTLSTVRLDNVTYGRFTGKQCAFEKLRVAWNFTSNPDQSNFQSMDEIPVRISLDAQSVLGNSTLGVKYSLQEVPGSQQLKLADIMSSFFRNLGRTVSVLLLGTVKQDRNSIETTTAIGLIVMACPDASIGRWEKRLGICLWNVPDPVAGEATSCREDVSILGGRSGWTQYSCLFG